MAEVVDFPPTGQPSRILSTGDGGGTSGGMEARVAKLEASVAHIQSDIADIKVDMRGFRADCTDLKITTSRMDETVKHLPGKGFIVVVVLLALTVIGAFITFQSQIQGFTHGSAAIDLKKN